jgi:hypothetical protein
MAPRAVIRGALFCVGYLARTGRDGLPQQRFVLDGNRAGAPSCRCRVEAARSYTTVNWRAVVCPTSGALFFGMDSHLGLLGSRAAASCASASTSPTPRRRARRLLTISCVSATSAILPAPRRSPAARNPQLRRAAFVPQRRAFLSHEPNKTTPSSRCHQVLTPIVTLPFMGVWFTFGARRATSRRQHTGRVHQIRAGDHIPRRHRNRPACRPDLPSARHLSTEPIADEMERQHPDRAQRCWNGLPTSTRPGRHV